MNKNAILTGSEGFIGKFITKKLEKEGYKVIKIDKNKSNISDKDFFKTDLNSNKDLSKTLIKIKSPPLSPDLNPIEMVWNEMKNYVKKQKCKKQSDYEIAISDFKSNLTPDRCKNYIDRLKKVHSLQIKNETFRQN